MIPEWKDLRKKSKKVRLINEPYFALAEEYINLKQKFQCEDTMEWLYLWFDMLLYPIYIVIRLCMQDYSFMSVITLAKTYQLWIDWFRLRELEQKVETWKATIRSLGGPWISSNNPELHVFVYADGMERIRYSKQKASLNPSRKIEKKSQVVEPPVQSQVSSQLKSPSVPSEAP